MCHSIYIHPSSQLSALFENDIVYSNGVRGFSLVELLVSVAIIAVLVALILPAYGRAKLKAQRVSCQVAVRSYAVEVLEYSGRFLIVIPQEANCHECHRPRYDAGAYLNTLEP